MHDESQSFDLPDVDKFTSGTVGPKGQRTFFLQATAGTEVITLKLEKQQVHALAEYLENMLTDLPEVNSNNVPFDTELSAPIIPQWVVATMGVAYQQSDNRIVLWAEEALTEEDLDDDANPASARFRITLGQATAFVSRSRDVVSAGRPPCPFCTAPLSAEGAWCACSN